MARHTGCLLKSAAAAAAAAVNERQTRNARHCSSIETPTTTAALTRRLGYPTILFYSICKRFLLPPLFFQFTNANAIQFIKFSPDSAMESTPEEEEEKKELGKLTYYAFRGWY